MDLIDPVFEWSVVELHQIIVFQAVAEELHFGRAAEKLHMAQPPVSRAIAQLEKSVGARLLDRSTRKVELTPIGVQFLAATRNILNAVTDAYNVVSAAKNGDSGVINVGFAGASTHKLVGSLSRELRRSYPNITTNLLSQNFAQAALDKMASGDIDIVLGRWDFLPPDIESRVVLEERLVLAVPRTHWLADFDAVSFSQLTQETFVELSAARSVLQDRLLRLAHAAGFEPQIVQRAPDTWTALALVSAEVGVSLTLDSVQHNTQDEFVRFIPVLDEAPAVELRMVWSSANSNPVLRNVIDIARKVWQLDG